MTKYIIKVCDLSVFRWAKNNSELWYIAILQKKSLLKNSVFWFSLVSFMGFPMRWTCCFAKSLFPELIFYFFQFFLDFWFSGEYCAKNCKSGDGTFSWSFLMILVFGEIKVLYEKLEMKILHKVTRIFRNVSGKPHKKLQ